MPEEATALETPVLLVAMPQVLDPFFHKSVVLLIHQSEEGSFGLIVNRRTDIHVSEILNGMEITWLGDREALALFGGPVQSQLGTVLFDARARPADRHRGVERDPPGGDDHPARRRPGEARRLCRPPPSGSSSATPAGVPDSWSRRSCATTGSPRR